MDLSRYTTRVVEPTCSPDEWNALRLRDRVPESVATWEQIRAHNLIVFYTDDLGTDMTTAKKAVLARAVTLQVWCELADSRMARGIGLPDEYDKRATALLRLLKELGIEKVKAKTTSLSAYLAGKAGNDAVSIETIGVPAWAVGT